MYWEGSVKRSPLEKRVLEKRSLKKMVLERVRETARQQVGEGEDERGLLSQVLLPGKLASGKRCWPPNLQSLTLM